MTELETYQENDFQDKLWDTLYLGSDLSAGIKKQIITRLFNLLMCFNEESFRYEEVVKEQTEEGDISNEVLY